MSDEAQYPLVTFALFAYNQEKYIREAVEGALAQDYPNLEIIISDDCSTDGTWEVIERTVAVKKDGRLIVLNRNPSNLGISAHVNAIFQMAKGELIVMAAGDDVSYPYRTSQLVDAWRKSQAKAAVIHSLSRIVIKHDATSDLARPQIGETRTLSPEAYVEAGMICPFRGQSAAYTPGLFAAFGPLDPRGSIEDAPLAFRAMLQGAPFIYVDAPLLDYRVTGDNTCMDYTRKDRARTVRWMRALRIAVEQQLLDLKLAQRSTPKLLLAMQAEQRRLLRCEGLASSNPFRLVAGAIAYTARRRLPDRIFMLIRYFGLQGGALHRLLRGLRWVMRNGAGSMRMRR